MRPIILWGVQPPYNNADLRKAVSHKDISWNADSHGDMTMFFHSPEAADEFASAASEIARGMREKASAKVAAE